MVSNILTQDVSVAGDVKKHEVDKLGLLSVVQSVPQDGKKLPPDSTKTKQTETTKGDLEQAVQRMNEHVLQVNRQLEFRIDEESGRTVITVRDSETQEVIRQIPGDEALFFARRLQQGDELELFNKFV